MKLVTDWKRAWRWFSVHAAALMVAWSMTPADTQVAIVTALHVPVDKVPALLGVLVILARLIEQRKKP